jgi:ADP-heptose:LPS heptosyltransferase
MKKILIINLRRLGDIYSQAHLINSLEKNIPCEISTLVYEECKKAALNLSNIQKVYTIDRQELITIAANKLFSDSLALDRLANRLDAIKETKWDIIINYSNDKVSSYLCSYLKNSAKKIIGVNYNEFRNIKSNTEWEILFNDYLPNTNNSPIHFVDCYHRMAGIPCVTAGNKVITDLNDEETAFKNTSNLRVESQTENMNCKIIGIQLCSSNIEKDIPTDVLIQYVRTLKESSEFVPLILIAPNNEERIKANKLNEYFNETLNIVEADLRAIGAVLLNIDLLVTPDTVLKHMADLLECPLLEISIGPSPLFKQGTYTAGNLILTDDVSTRNFKNANTKITASDIWATTLYIYSKSKQIRPRLSDGVSLYKCTKDSLGANYICITGTANPQSEINRLMSRQLISSLLDNAEPEENYSEILKYGHPSATTWCNKEKIVITDVMKDLLGTLRALLQGNESKRTSRDFVINLGKLLTNAEVESSTQIPVILFKTKIENLDSTTYEANAKEVELLLYELKTNLQKNLVCIKHLEEKIQTAKKEEFTRREMSQQ